MSKYICNVEAPEHINLQQTTLSGILTNTLWRNSAIFVLALQTSKQTNEQKYRNERAKRQNEGTYQ